MNYWVNCFLPHPRSDPTSRRHATNIKAGKRLQVQSIAEIGNNPPHRQGPAIATRQYGYCLVAVDAEFIAAGFLISTSRP